MVSSSHNNRIFGPGSSIYHLYTRHIKVTNLRTQYLVQINKQMQSTCAHQNLLHPVGHTWLFPTTETRNSENSLTLWPHRICAYCWEIQRDQMLLIPGSVSCLSLSVLSCCKTTWKKNDPSTKTTNKKKTLRKHLAQLSHETNVCRFPSYRLLNIFILIMGYFPDGG